MMTYRQTLHQAKRIVAENNAKMNNTEMIMRIINNAKDSISDICPSVV